MNKAFAGFDWSNFWVPSRSSHTEYVDVAPTAAMIRKVETQLGYTLPPAYVAMARIRNGGIPRLTAHKIARPKRGVSKYVAITGIFSIGEKKQYSLCGELGSAFWLSEWQYPPIGVYFANCPSAGHDMMCLDYRKCGPNGEPRVVHVDAEDDNRISAIAPNFEAFIRGLVSSNVFDHED